MDLKVRDCILPILTIIVTVIVFQLPPTSQPPAFHDFADGRTIFGIHNFLNVASNLPFLIIASYGFYLLRNTWTSVAIHTIYSVLFLGVGLTAFGSAYYHYNPNNYTLVWDRGPLTIIFMAVTCATIAAFINERLGFLFLIPLILLGIGSVLWWSFTEAKGHGDLRLYFLLQYYPMVLIPLILWLYYKPDNRSILKCLSWVVFWYVVAKLFERWDRPVFEVLHVSGHTLKHLAAAVSTWYFVEMYKKKYIGKPNEEWLTRGGFNRAQ